MSYNKKCVNCYHVDYYDGSCNKTIIIKNILPYEAKKKYMNAYELAKIIPPLDDNGCNNTTLNRKAMKILNKNGNCVYYFNKHIPTIIIGLALFLPISFVLLNINNPYFFIDLEIKILNIYKIFIQKGGYMLQFYLDHPIKYIGLFLLWVYGFKIVWKTIINK